MERGDLSNEIHEHYTKNIDEAEPTDPVDEVVLEAGVPQEDVSEEDRLHEEAMASIQKITRLGRAYSMRFAREYAKQAPAAKRISMNKAIKLDKEKTLTSITTELKMLDAKGTFHPVDVISLYKSEVKRIIRSFMFLTEKNNANGNFLKLKSRLVGMGIEHDRSTLDMDVSSPTVSSTAVYGYCRR